MGFSGNRFGGVSRAGSSLDNLMLRRRLLSEADKKKRQPVKTAQMQGMGFGGQPGTMMSSGPSSDSEAFNERRKNKALYGDRWNTKGGIGRQGLMREEMRSREGIQEGINDVTRQELKGKYNTDTFSGDPLGTEHVRAQAAMEEAQAKRLAARRGLIKEPKIHKVEGYSPDGGMNTEFFERRVDPQTGQPIMAPVPRQTQGVTPSPNKAKPKKKKDEGWASNWANWLN